MKEWLLCHVPALGMVLAFVRRKTFWAHKSPQALVSSLFLSYIEVQEPACTLEVWGRFYNL